MQYLGHQLTIRDLGHSAIVFSPHPDDETLGCGGTIIKKRKEGARVQIVYMTDGRRSHVPLIDEETLAEVRAREALKACQKLGVYEDHITFLGYEDAKLRDGLEAARKKVMAILCLAEPREIFIPYRLEALEDHWATNRCVLAALRDYEAEITVYEYPVWFWHQWPWVTWSQYCMREKLDAAFKTCLSNVRMLTDFGHAVWIGDVLSQKYEALSQHRSQMTRLVADPHWLTLSDISNGEWLQCFFHQNEIFYRHDYCKNRN
ncbi:MAG: PIG-L family deacetylase [Thermodesulfobacteriota bacterium]|nr:PIG-L family deacetylase [Thermodesulfobacteriota bacterium]